MNPLVCLKFGGGCGNGEWSFLALANKGAGRVTSKGMERWQSY